MDDILKLKELCSKYSYLGLKIAIEFNISGVVFHGYWATVRNYCDTNIIVQDTFLSFRKIYEYDLLKSYDLEDLLELFKEQFENERRK